MDFIFWGLRPVVFLYELASLEILDYYLLKIFSTSSPSRQNRESVRSPDFVVVSPKGLDGALELVRDVELVRVEEQEDAVDALGKPLENADKIITAVRALLLAGQDAGGVDDRNACKNMRGMMMLIWLTHESAINRKEAAYLFSRSLSSSPSFL